MFEAVKSFVLEPRHGIVLWSLIIGALGVGFVFLGILCAVPSKFRKIIVAFVTFVAGLFYSLEFLIPKENVLTKFQPNLANFAIVVGSFTLLLGIGNLFDFHGRSIVKKTQGWGNSVAFFVSFFAIMIAGFLKDAKIGPAESIFGILFSGFMVSLQSTTFSLVAFYIVSAAYRAFRIRSVESALMMGAAAIIMLALVPVGVILTDWLPRTGLLSALRLEKLGYWILVSPNMAVQRAIGFGIAVGALATGLRIWLSLERGSFYDRQL